MRRSIAVAMTVALMISGLVMTTMPASAQGACKTNGANGPDVIGASSGNDSVCGLGGADTLFGGSGKDALFGGEGDDALDGESGSDTLTGGNGADVFSGGSGYDVATDFECGVDSHDGTVEQGTDCPEEGGEAAVMTPLPNPATAVAVKAAVKSSPFPLKAVKSSLLSISSPSFPSSSLPLKAILATSSSLPLKTALAVKEREERILTVLISRNRQPHAATWDDLG